VNLENDPRMANPRRRRDATLCRTSLCLNDITTYRRLPSLCALLFLGTFLCWSESGIVSKFEFVKISPERAKAATPPGRQPTPDDDDDDDPCRGKERVLQILRDANVTVDADLCSRLPTWRSISDLYGEEPIVSGLETCASYRQLLLLLQQQQQHPSGVVAPMPRVGGLYNTGTNALVWTFLENLERIGEKDLIGTLHPYEVPWGKHTAAKHRFNVTVTVPFPSKDNTSESHLHTLPIILIRDPYRWMYAICKKSYAVHWRSSSGRCPSLVEDTDDNPSRTTQVQVKPLARNGQVGVGVETYASMADLWTEWNLQYLDADFPRLIVRFEDYLFHTRRLFDIILECAGIPPLPQEQPFVYHTEPAKVHGGASIDFVEAIIKYGTAHGRSKGFSDADLEYAQEALDVRLMELFHYHHPR
jgi:hypothetical protein